MSDKSDPVLAFHLVVAPCPRWNDPLEAAAGSVNLRLDRGSKILTQEIHWSDM